MITTSSQTQHSLDRTRCPLEETRRRLSLKQRPLKHSRGFSLIELMVVVLIVGILAGIAVPSYLSSIRQSRRTDAKAALLDLAAREERYFATNNGAYTSTLSNLGYSSNIVGNGYYQVAVTSVTTGTTTQAAAFTLTATPAPGSPQLKDAPCTSFTLTNTGVQGAGGSDVNAAVNCWNGSNQ